jgi:hypothetical protein
MKYRARGEYPAGCTHARTHTGEVRGTSQPLGKPEPRHPAAVERLVRWGTTCRSTSPPIAKRVNRNRKKPPKTTRLFQLAVSTYHPERGGKHCVPTLRRRTPVYIGLRAATCVDLRLRLATYVYAVMSVYVWLRLATRRRHGLSTRRLRMSRCVYSIDARRRPSVNFIMLFTPILH